MDFESGKLIDTVQRGGSGTDREYRLLGLVLFASSLPWLIGAWFWPFATLVVFLFAGYFQILISFATSSGTDTAHHIRFLLCGSNPIGMTGASSLLFGAVDSVVDWKEDAGERSARPARFWLLTIYKFAMTWVGALLMASEYFWDAVLMRRPQLVRHKWNELFALADYHGWICPEKSNDIFYADLAFARYREDPWLYQWNRLRAMVFELEHYRRDAERGVGVPETNVFLQDELAAWQTLRRLQLSAIETAVAEYFAEDITRFPLPQRLAESLIRNARPIAHYLRMRQELVDGGKLGPELSVFAHHGERCVYRNWVLFHAYSGDHPVCGVEQADLVWLREAGLIESPSPAPVGNQVIPTDLAVQMLRGDLHDAFRRAEDHEADQLPHARVPRFLDYAGQVWIPTTGK